MDVISGTWRTFSFASLSPSFSVPNLEEEAVKLAGKDGWIRFNEFLKFAQPTELCKIEFVDRVFHKTDKDKEDEEKNARDERRRKVSDVVKAKVKDRDYRIRQEIYVNAGEIGGHIELKNGACRHRGVADSDDFFRFGRAQYSCYKSLKGRSLAAKKEISVFPQ